MSSVADRLAGIIRAHGPIPVAHYMAEANAHYYALRDPLGAAGDFTTAPEISQMFGELIGLCLADLWSAAGRPAAYYVELGPGRGTLAADALRAMRAAGLTPEVAFVETSAVLRAAQASRVPDASWHEDVFSLPGDAPLLVVANEFFDALPVRQCVATAQSWRERVVAHRDDAFAPEPGPRIVDGLVPDHLRGAEPGAIFETSLASHAVVQEIARRIARQGGAALIVDYGHVRSALGDTLQAVSRHQFADPWIEPGSRDLTAHVDFEALAAAARAEGVAVHGPRDQGEWLVELGLDARASALSAAAPARAGEIRTARDRLVAPEQMGTLFKTLAFTARDWPKPAGFR